MGGRRSVSVEVLIELVTRINGEKEPIIEGQKEAQSSFEIFTKGGGKIEIVFILS